MNIYIKSPPTHPLQTESVCIHVCVVVRLSERASEGVSGEGRAREGGGGREGEERDGGRDGSGDGERTHSAFCFCLVKVP